jgi:hypothetical protein
MRQVSGLGMEDPVFRTTEITPKHPSLVFDDMGLDDIPEDMQDLISIASDPTAASGKGLDRNFFSSCLNGREKTRPSIMDNNLLIGERTLSELYDSESLDKITFAKPQLQSDELCPLEDSSVSYSLSSMNSQIINKERERDCRKGKTLKLHDSSLRSSETDGSIELDGILFDKRSCSSAYCRVKKKYAQQCDSFKSTDNLLLEAAQAMEKSEDKRLISRELIDMAKRQHTWKPKNIDLENPRGFPIIERRRSVTVPTMNGIFASKNRRNSIPSRLFEI